jgi:hypothetical protein
MFMLLNVVPYQAIFKPYDLSLGQIGVLQCRPVANGKLLTALLACHGRHHDIVGRNLSAPAPSFRHAEGNCLVFVQENP